jgi:hypothetical protein
MQRSRQQTPTQQTNLKLEACFNVLDKFAAARSLEEFQEAGSIQRSSSGSSAYYWQETLQLLSPSDLDRKGLLLAQSLFKPVCAAVANALRLLAAEDPATLLQQVRLQVRMPSDRVNMLWDDC